MTCALLVEGACFPITIGTTRDQQLTSSVVTTRVSSQRADIDGSQCYVDQKTRVRVRRHVPRDSRLFAGLELLGGSIASLFGVPAMYFGLPFVFDGLFTAVYIKAVDDKEVVKTKWEPTTDTSACRR